MNTQDSNQPLLSARLDTVRQQLTNEVQDESSLGIIADEFCKLSVQAQETSQDVVRRGADLLVQISELAASLNSAESNAGDRDQLIQFLGDGVSVLDNALESGDGSESIDSFIDLAKENWPDYFSDLDGVQYLDDPFANDAWDYDADSEGEDDDQELDSNQVAMMLSALSGIGSGLTPPKSEPSSTAKAAIETDEESNKQKFAEVKEPAKQTPESQTESTSESASVDFIPEPPKGADEVAAQKLADDPEMLEAYLDDALRCVASMEQSAIAIEQDDQNREPVRQFCRELHTLKGASATIGLSELASYLHDLESSLESIFGDEQATVNSDLLFVAVDQVRTMIGSLQPNEDQSDVALVSTNQSKPNRPKKDFLNFSNNSNDDASIRIRASKLDRLMDMLAELVVLRNRQESDVHEFNDLNEELTRCSTRVMVADEAARLQQSIFENNEFEDLEVLQGSTSSAVLTEVSKDIAAVSRGLRDLQKPIAQNSVSITRFIRDFRQELMQLRRVPVTGMFNRLQRAARDAAKTEAKAVRVQLAGQNVGLEQEIQERLFESLLHVVRNSVSHGIESESDRVKAGKDTVGTITLEASSNAQLLIIEVRDDGAGIDYDAVRKRATEKGLILPGQEIAKEQLGKLIFHPGFSTKETASAISGRGVGMDVVAAAIEQLKGRIEIDSVRGEGTKIRLSIPLKSGIEHVMVFRSGEELFALPMQAVSSAKRANGNNAVSVSDVFGFDTASNSDAGDVLHVRRANTAGNQNTGSNNLAVHVDELIGPEEVVVRKLPNLLWHHPLFSGITLSGSGKKVLLLNAEQFASHCEQASDLDLDSSVPSTTTETDSNQKRVLVVDDSLTARRALSKVMRANGYQVAEAGDGIKAIKLLRRQSFDLVLTDLDMPKMGGLELLLDIQSGGYCDAAKVVVSSRNEQTFREQAAEAGANDYITKPITEKAVKQMLDNLALLETSKGDANDE